MRQSEMTPLQSVLYHSYRLEWLKQKDHEKTVNHLLHELKKARAAKANGQQYLEKVHAVAIEHGLGFANFWPVEAAPEKALDYASMPVMD